MHDFVTVYLLLDAFSAPQLKQFPKIMILKVNQGLHLCNSKEGHFYLSPFLSDQMIYP